MEHSVQYISVINFTEGTVWIQLTQCTEYLLMIGEKSSHNFTILFFMNLKLQLF